MVTVAQMAGGYIGEISTSNPAASIGVNAGIGSFVVALVSWRSGNLALPAVSWGGTPMQPVTNARQLFDNYASFAVYVLQNPPAGDVSLTVRTNQGAGGPCAVSWASFTGAGSIANVTLSHNDASWQQIEVDPIQNGAGWTFPPPPQGLPPATYSDISSQEAAALAAAAPVTVTNPDHTTTITYPQPNSAWSGINTVQVSMSKAPTSVGLMLAIGLYNTIDPGELTFYQTTFTGSGSWQATSASGTKMGGTQAVCTTIETSPTVVLAQPSAEGFSIVTAMIEVLPLVTSGGTGTQTSIVSSKVVPAGVLSGSSFSTTFDPTGGDLMLIFIGWQGTLGYMPSITFGSANVPIIDNVTHVDSGMGTMIMGAIISPPKGQQTLTVTTPAPPNGYLGSAMIGLVSLKGTSGALGYIGGLFNGGQQVETTPQGISGGSALITFAMAEYSPPSYLAASSETTPLASGSQATNAAWLFATQPGNAAAVEFLGSGYGNFQLIQVEVLPGISAAADLSCAANLNLAGVATSGAFGQAFPTPNGQKLGIYWDSWTDVPSLVPPTLNDFYLTHIPPVVDELYLSFGKPQCTYTGLGSNIQNTTGLNWNYSASMFKSALALLKSRNPNLQIHVAVQQAINGMDDNPYNPAGWGGLTTQHVAAWKLFCDDMGLAGVVLDYEVLSDTYDFAHHCSKDANGKVTCYTDSELLKVVNMFRDGLPRPNYKLSLDAMHVGAFGEDQWAAAEPQGFNDGYCLVLAKNPSVAAKLDYLHVMTYDVPAPYDARQAWDAYRYYFPNLPIYIGLRVGPPDYGGQKKTVADFIDMANKMLMQNGGGAFIYSMLWDIGTPSGNYGPDYPNADLCAHAVAKVFGKSAAALASPLVTRQESPSTSLMIS